MLLHVLRHLCKCLIWFSYCSTLRFSGAWAWLLNFADSEKPLSCIVFIQVTSQWIIWIWLAPINGEMPWALTGDIWLMTFLLLSWWLFVIVWSTRTRMLRIPNDLEGKMETSKENKRVGRKGQRGWSTRWGTRIETMRGTRGLRGIMVDLSSQEGISDYHGDRTWDISSLICELIWQGAASSGNPLGFDVHQGMVMKRLCRHGERRTSRKYSSRAVFDFDASLRVGATAADLLPGTPGSDLKVVRPFGTSLSSRTVWSSKDHIALSIGPEHDGATYACRTDLSSMTMASI